MATPCGQRGGCDPGHCRAEIIYLLCYGSQCTALIALPVTWAHGTLEDSTRALGRLRRCFPGADTGSPPAPARGRGHLSHTASPSVTPVPAPRASPATPKNLQRRG